MISQYQSIQTYEGGGYFSKTKILQLGCMTIRWSVLRQLVRGVMSRDLTINFNRSKL
jgi:hypothetical protein